jgi:hypothetical protein
VCAAIGVYASYAFGQYRRLSDLRQRQLSSAAAELKASLETARGTVAEFHKKWVAQTRDADKPTVCEFDKGQPYLDVDECETAEWRHDLIARPVTSPALGIDAVPAPASDEPAGSHDAIHFRFRTDVVLKELAFPDAFELIFVATDDGVVLYEEAPTQRRWLRYLRRGEQAFRDSHADAPPLLQIQNLQHIVGSDAWNRLRSVSTRTRLQLGGVAHHLFFQPLSLDSGGVRKDLIVGGAVPTSVIVGDSLALDTGVVGLLAFLLLLIVLGFPFIKLMFLDPHERLRQRDINLLYLSSCALLVLLTCASLAWDGYVRWRADANAGLKDLAAGLGETFRREVTDIRDQLSEYDLHVGRWQIDCDREPVQTQWFAAAPTEQPPARHTLAMPTRPIQLRQVGWIRPDNGRQIWKATSDSIKGRTVLDGRFYVRAVRDRHLFDTKDGGRPFFFGTDRSIVNGRFYAFLSMESSLPATYCNGTTLDRPLIASATAQLLSLDLQPLPAGYGFALVNREGRTLFHSDRRLSLRENFFDELSKGARARAMMYANKSGPLESRYREQPHELYLQSLDFRRIDGGGPAGFYLVAFRDISVERAVVGRVLVEGLSGPVLLLSAIFAAGLSGLSLASRLAGSRWSAWLWPHGGLGDVYKWQATAFAVLLSGSLALYPAVGSDVFLASPLLASAFGVGIYLLLARRGRARSRLTASVWHAASITLVLVCIVVVPSAALFRFALSYEFAKLIVTEREWIEAQKADAVTSTEVQAVEDNHALVIARERAAERPAHFVSVPAPFDVSLPEESTGPAIAGPRRAGVTPIGRDDIVLDVMQGWLGFLLPIDDAIAARQQGQSPGFTYSPGGTLLESPRASTVAFIGLALTLGLLVWWIRWNTNHLFFADAETNGDAPPLPESFEALWATRSPDERMVLLQVAHERIANPYQRSTIRVLLRDGLLTLNPDLQPCSGAFEQFLRQKEHDLQPQLLSWEQVNVGHSWRYVRLALVAGVTCLGFFLVVTQPALQSSLLGIATGITGVLTTGLKARDAIASWFAARKGTVGLTA